MASIFHFQASSENLHVHGWPFIIETNRLHDVQSLLNAFSNQKILIKNISARCWIFQHSVPSKWMRTRGKTTITETLETVWKNKMQWHDQKHFYQAGCRYFHFLWHVVSHRPKTAISDLKKKKKLFISSYLEISLESSFIVTPHKLLDSIIVQCGSNTNVEVPLRLFWRIS